MIVAQSLKLADVTPTEHGCSCPSASGPATNTGRAFIRVAMSDREFDLLTAPESCSWFAELITNLGHWTAVLGGTTRPTVYISTPCWLAAVLQPEPDRRSLSLSLFPTQTWSGTSRAHSTSWHPLRLQQHLRSCLHPAQVRREIIMFRLSCSFVISCSSRRGISVWTAARRTAMVNHSPQVTDIYKKTY